MAVSQAWILAEVVPDFAVVPATTASDRAAAVAGVPE
jgi:hypothetical protein